MTVDLEKRFIVRMRELLVSLPYDLRVLFEAISDENIPLESRQWAAAAAIYCLSPFDPIPDSSGLAGYVDDVIMVKLVLQRFLELGGEDTRGYVERFPEQFENLEPDLALFTEVLGPIMTWLREKMTKELLKTKYKGKDSLKYVQDEESWSFLYDEGQNFTTQYEIDDEAVSKLQSVRSIIDVFQRRISANTSFSRS